MTRRIPILDDRGAALVIALLALMLLMALGVTLVLNTATEVLIAAQFRTSQEAFYAADAAVQRAADGLSASPDWNRVLSGAESSAFAVGPSSGSRILSDGSTVDLLKITNGLNCGHPAACSPAEMDAVTAERPWGPNNPRWNLYAYGPLDAMVSTGTINSAMYVAVWLADDTSETDNDPLVDGSDPSNPGKGLVTIHGEAFGPGAAHKTVEATFGRRAAAPAGGNHIVAWRQVR
jgi:hypothetical protein